MGAGRHGRGEFVEHGLHRDRTHLGQNQGHAVVALGADGAEQIEGIVPEVAPAAWADAFSNQRRQVRPVWPILASSKNQSSSRSASGWAAAISAISAGNFF